MQIQRFLGSDSDAEENADEMEVIEIFCRIQRRVEEESIEQALVIRLKLA